MNKKRVLIISIFVILLLIGGSFAYWMVRLTQSSTNNIATSCFNLSLTENNAIDLQSAFPLRDSEGMSLNPYEFTITNNCSTYAYYEVNLEINGDSDLNPQYIKVMLDEENPTILSTKLNVTPTLTGYNDAYRLKTAYLHASESKTYNLRLWIDEDATLDDNISSGEEFSAKITIKATYKPDAPTMLEECEAEYGEGAAVCNIIAQADPANNKCLHTDQNGMITDYSATMSDADTPIVCAMEDDYGTSYYLRGLHTDNNVKFADSCWKIIRTTGTGGIKMIYNGDLDSNGKCTTTSGNHTGFTGQTLSLSGNKLYGTSYTKEGSTYTLSDTSSMNWSTDTDNIIGKYTCGNTNSSCTALYAVTGKYTSSYAYVVQLDQSTNYAQIGTSAFNYYYSSPNYMESTSPALMGYMYNDTYPDKQKNLSISGATILSVNQANTSNYYYGDSITFNNGLYYITNQDNSDVTQLDWASNYETNLIGKYTCKGTSKYDNKTIRCYTAYKVLDTTTVTNYMISENLTDGRLEIGDIKLATSYSENNGIYELTSPVVTLSAMDWYNGYSDYNNYYICGNYNLTMCNDLKIIKNTDPQKTFSTLIELNNNYYYGSSFTYDENNQRPYTLTDTVQFWDIMDSTNKTNINTHHYTCFYGVDNTCNELYFIYYLSGTTAFYIKLEGNETVSDALDKMLRNDNINVKDSHIKGVIDWWYETNILGTTNENKLEDTVFCNDRTIENIGGWSENGTSNISLRFNAYNTNLYLKCQNKKDAFNVSDINHGNSALIYPIGLTTLAENILTGNANARKTGSSYWLLDASFLTNSATYYVMVIPADGRTNSTGNIIRNLSGVRPAISLKPGTTFVAGGDGSASNPYEVDMS